MDSARRNSPVDSGADEQNGVLLDLGRVLRVRANGEGEGEGAADGEAEG